MFLPVLGKSFFSEVVYVVHDLWYVFSDAKPSFVALLLKVEDIFVNKRTVVM